MKTNKTILIILFFLSISSFAQQGMNEKKEQIKALKVGFITNELALTTEELPNPGPYTMLSTTSNLN